MANEKRLKDIKLDSCELIFRNFAGTEGKFNRAGDRNFCVILNEDEAKSLKAAGWNVKQRPPREDGEVLPPYLKVKVKFHDDGTPKIYRLDLDPSGKPRRDPNGDVVKAVLTPDTVGQLDSAYIVDAQLTISPYHYDVNGSKGVSAYCRELTVVIKMDPWTAKYEDFSDDIPDSALNTTEFKVVNAGPRKLVGTNEPEF